MLWLNTVKKRYVIVQFPQTKICYGLKSDALEQVLSHLLVRLIKDSYLCYDIYINVLLDYYIGNNYRHLYKDSKIVPVCPYPEKRNHLSFVNISPTLVIDTSMERSSRVLQHGNPKNDFLFKEMFT